MATPTVNTHEALPAPETVSNARPASTPRPPDRLTDRRAMRAREQLVADGFAASIRLASRRDGSAASHRAGTSGRPKMSRAAAHATPATISRSSSSLPGCEQAARLERRLARGQQRAERPAAALDHVGLQAARASARALASSPLSEEWVTSSTPPGRRCAGACATDRSSSARPSRPGLPGARGPAVRQLVVRRRHVRRVGDDQVEALAGHRVRTGSPRSARTRTPLSRALSRAVSDRAPRDVDGGHRVAPARAAAIASAPLPVHRSSTAPRGPGAARRRRAAEHPRVARGRKTPGSRTIRTTPSTRPLQPGRSTPPELRAALRRARRRSRVGLEEELMLLDPATLAPAPRAAEVSTRAAATRASSSSCPPRSSRSSRRPPRRSPTRVARAGRRRAATSPRAADGVGAPGRRRRAPVRRRRGRAERRASATSAIAARVRRVAAPPAGRARCRSTSRSAAPTARSPSTTRCARYLPELAALAANAPFHDGRDTGLASIRPKICELLPRQGVPPAIASWEAFAATLALGRARRRRARAGPLVVGAAPAPRARDARAARARRADHARRRRRRSPRSPTRWSPGSPTRHDAGEPPPAGADLADRGEPLVGAAPRRRRHARRPRDGRARRPRASCSRSCSTRSRRRRAARLRGRARADARAAAAQRRRAPARAAAAAAASSRGAWLADARPPLTRSPDG